MYKESATKYMSSQSYGRSPCENWQLERHSRDLAPQAIRGCLPRLQSAGPAISQSIPRHRATENGDAAWDLVMTVSPGGMRRRTDRERGCPRRAQLSPHFVVLLYLSYHIIHLCIHSFTSSTNILHVTDTAPCPRDKMISKRLTLPTPLQPRS